MLISLPVRFTHAALDETPHGDIVLRGVVECGSLGNLLSAEYQREVRPLSSINQLMEAMEKGSVPDIELGVRGNNFTETKPGDFLLTDPVYIIDGLQRVTAARLKIEKKQGKSPRLGALVHFGTTEAWERERFLITNLKRSKLSPNILLRNMKYDFPAIKLLYDLNEDRGFIMGGRVCWKQQMSRAQELITAMTLTRVIGRLHAHLGPTRGSRVEELTAGLQKVADKVGKNIFRDNIRTFFEVVDGAWGIQRIVYREGAVYIRSAFLESLADVFSNHTDFWEGNRLAVDRTVVRKLQLFPYTDPLIEQLASGGKSTELLCLKMVEHIDSGKRTKRLSPRVPYRSMNSSPINEVEEEVAVSA